MKRRHLIVLGGFLGAGKTSAMLALARWLGDQGLRAACVTNDQAEDLVDTALLRGCGVATDEVAGGCFCCRFDALLAATSRLRVAIDPDVIVAEAVGSCTDLAATVAAPMRRLAGDAFTMAPLAVVVDAGRARHMLGLDAGERWSPDVTYLFRKQLEEAEVIAVNKCDLLPPAAIDELVGAIGTVAPAATIHRVSMTSGAGTERLFAALLEARDARATPQPIEVDYGIYAAGEAELGWLNAAFTAAAPRAMDGNLFLEQVVDSLGELLLGHRMLIGHLKLALHGDAAGTGVAVAQSVTAEAPPVMTSRLAVPIEQAHLVLNLRTQADPALLEALVRRLPGVVGIGGGAGWRLTLDSIRAFRPAPPVPTHRDVSL